MSRPPLLLFVCTGNICRSPMAAAIAKDLARRQNLDVRIESAGTSAWDGEPPTASARQSLAAIGVVLDEHRARLVDHSLLEDATLIVGMTDHHRDRLRSAAPDLAAKIVSFNDLTGLGNVPDPVGGVTADYDQVRDLLVRGVPHVLAVVGMRSTL